MSKPFSTKSTTYAYFDKQEDAEAYAHSVMQNEEFKDCKAHVSSPTELFKEGLSLLPRVFYWSVTVNYSTGIGTDAYFNVKSSPTQAQPPAAKYVTTSNGMYATSNPGNHTHSICAGDVYGAKSNR